MSADSSDAGEEEIEPGVHNDDVGGSPSPSSFEVHVQRHSWKIDISLTSSKPDGPRKGDSVAGDEKYWRHRSARRGREHLLGSWRVGRAHGGHQFEGFRVSTAAPGLSAPSRRLTSAFNFRRGAGPSVSFWEALSPVEQHQFRSRAEARTFAARAHLMREGESAERVLVILDGQTKVCVDDQGTERIIARRGPGELIGERAALQVSVRSATVVALDTVQALVMQTGDFAAFLSAHPGVLGIVENQVYDRLTEEPPHSAGNDGFGGQDGTAADDASAVWFQRFQTRPFTGENCTIIFTDVVGFSSAQRDDNDRLHIRQQLALMTYAALKAVWSECFWDDRGDGFLVVVPPTVPTSKVLEFLLVALPIALKQHNEACDPSSQFQLRAALDVGAVVSDNTGVSGQVIINTKRMLDSLTLKKAIGDSDVPLGLIVSESVYQYTVKHAAFVTDSATYKKIRVSAKDSSLTAWMSLVHSPIQVPPPRCTHLLAVG